MDDSNQEQKYQDVEVNMKRLLKDKSFDQKP